MTDVLVLSDGQGGVPSQNTLELLGAARQVADATGGKVQAAVFEDATTGLSTRLFAYGADRVFRPSGRSSFFSCWSWLSSPAY